MSTRSILWPVDTTEESLSIAGYVAEMSRKFDARIIVLYVGLDIKASFPAYGNYPSPEVYKDFERWERKEARKRLEEVCARSLDGCPGMEVRVEMGNPAETILEVAQKEGVSMIIMATHGLDPNAAAANIFGSVAQQVVRDARVPVYVINPKTCSYQEEPAPVEGSSIPVE
jgi:nucleotide-binding universal stress UspA family protein